MNTRTNKTVLLITLMICLATAVYSAVGTFTFRTSGASDTTEVVDLRYPQKVPEDASVTTDSIADGSITNDKLAEPVSVANGGTGKTTAAEGLAALGGASLNGSSTVDFAAKSVSGKVGSAAVLRIVEISLADGAAISLKTLLDNISSPNGSVRITNVGPYSNAGGEVVVTGDNNIATVVLDYGNIEAADTAGNVCLFSAGSGDYTLRNRIGAVATYSIFYQGER